MADEKPVNRRRFFREGLKELLKPLAKAVVPLERAAEQLRHLEGLSPPPEADKRPAHGSPRTAPAPHTVARDPKGRS